MSFKILEREMTDAEYAWMRVRLEEDKKEQDCHVQAHEQYGFVALMNDTFIGCASGRAYKEDSVPTGWFYLSDLFVEKAYRKHGLGALLLGRLEARAGFLGVQNIWTDTAGYEAPGFYKKQGYDIVCERENRYPTGHSEVLMRKQMSPLIENGRCRLSGSIHRAVAIRGCHIEERLMTPAEYARMNAGFDEHTIEHGNLMLSPIRHGFVALDGDQFIDCISGLAGWQWFFITDLFVQKSYRARGIGTDMLHKMEERAASLGSNRIWVWAIGHAAVWYSEKQGYDVCCQFHKWTRAGHSRVGLKKTIAA